MGNSTSTLSSDDELLIILNKFRNANNFKELIPVIKEIASNQLIVNTENYLNFFFSDIIETPSLINYIRNLNKDAENKSKTFKQFLDFFVICQKQTKQQLVCPFDFLINQTNINLSKYVIFNIYKSENINESDLILADLIDDIIKEGKSFFDVSKIFESRLRILKGSYEQTFSSIIEPSKINEPFIEDNTATVLIQGVSDQDINRFESNIKNKYNLPTFTLNKPETFEFVEKILDLKDIEENYLTILILLLTKLDLTSEEYAYLFDLPIKNSFDEIGKTYDNLNEYLINGADLSNGEERKPLIKFLLEIEDSVEYDEVDYIKSFIDWCKKRDLNISIRSFLNAKGDFKNLLMHFEKDKYSYDKNRQIFKKVGSFNARFDNLQDSVISLTSAQRERLNKLYDKSKDIYKSASVKAEKGLKNFYKSTSDDVEKNLKTFLKSNTLTIKDDDKIGNNNKINYKQFLEPNVDCDYLSLNYKKISAYINEKDIRILPKLKYLEENCSAITIKYINEHSYLHDAFHSIKSVLKKDLDKFTNFSKKILFKTAKVTQQKLKEFFDFVITNGVQNLDLHKLINQVTTSQRQELINMQKIEMKEDEKELTDLSNKEKELKKKILMEEIQARNEIINQINKPTDDNFCPLAYKEELITYKALDKIKNKIADLINKLRNGKKLVAEIEKEEDFFEDNKRELAQKYIDLQNNICSKYLNKLNYTDDLNKLISFRKMYPKFIDPKNEIASALLKRSRNFIPEVITKTQIDAERNLRNMIG